MSSSERSERAPARRPSVLVVDDSDLVRAIVIELIRASGEFRVVGEARTGFEAIRLVHELNPELVTLDLQMPDLGGLESLAYIMSEVPRPVIIPVQHSPVRAASPRCARSTTALWTSC